MSAGVTVLVAEDDAAIASFINRALSALEFATDWVTTGGEVLDRVVAGGVGVLVLDLGLPDLDGIEVLRALRERDSGIPVVIVTARTDVPEAALRLGVECYLRKPFPLSELLDAVRACVEGGTAQRAES